MDKKINGNYVDTGIHSKIDVIDAQKHNYFGFRDILEPENFPFPLAPGTYTVKNVTLDSSKFPPLFPSGSYRLRGTVDVNKIKAIIVELYATIKYSPLYFGLQ